LLNSERLDGAPDTTSPSNGEGHEYHNHGSTLIPSMLYDEIIVVFRFTSGIFQTLVLNLNLFALNIILILQTNKVSLLRYQHIPAKLPTLKCYYNVFWILFQNKYNITVISYCWRNLFNIFLSKVGELENPKTLF